GDFVCAGTGAASARTASGRRRTAAGGIANRRRWCHRAPMHSLYPLFRPLLFALDPEKPHDATFRALDVAARAGLAQRRAPQLPVAPVDAMRLRFPNRVGLAAGLDKNAAHLAGLATLGFGFL